MTTTTISGISAPRARGWVHDGEVRELAIDGTTYRFRLNVETDDDKGAPWDEEDGHGPVSDWTTRDKRPGEWVLSSDHGSKRFYDVAEANRIAKRDGWGLSDAQRQALIARLAKDRVVRRPVGNATVSHRFGGLMQEHRRATETVTIPGRDPSKPLTEGELRAEAVRLDFEHLRRWAADQWHWVGVVVTLLGEDEDMDDLVANDYGHALWGIDSDSDGYLEGVAMDLMAEAANEAHRETLEAAHWASRDVETH
ncbi:TPA: hypothetical protein QDB15_000005 [Burkholderia vietnamiensis]|uniref:Uncharacterized protein n=2 Tax=Burkholderiaceae TaxID=119060 RepID=A0A5E5P2P5_9BURK|nr:MULTISPECIES: hypothetical protein [Burkholderiaceae]AOZ05924.1 hypothetical protein BKK80_08875 [Cupriavidus malaysiensis]MCA8206279.1 hypothetical protein [Burkholderia vietnamiensis]VVG70453.1 hypothetical protein PAP18089_01413 [Pandoraea apista]HDR8943077.1 hypothetical protein [Burkholderia vietnamiensis]HDR9116281.1 hypothetical protein [Burkholderia vietnamiensis]